MRSDMKKKVVMRPNSAGMHKRPSRPSTAGRMMRPQSAHRNNKEVKRTIHPRIRDIYASEHLRGLDKAKVAKRRIEVKVKEGNQEPELLLSTIRHLKLSLKHEQDEKLHATCKIRRLEELIVKKDKRIQEVLELQSSNTGTSAANHQLASRENKSNKLNLKLQAKIAMQNEQIAKYEATIHELRSSTKGTRLLELQVERDEFFKEATMLREAMLQQDIPKTKMPDAICKQRTLNKVEESSTQDASKGILKRTRPKSAVMAKRSPNMHAKSSSPTKEESLRRKLTKSREIQDTVEINEPLKNKMEAERVAVKKEKKIDQEHVAAKKEKKIDLKHVPTQKEKNQSEKNKVDQKHIATKKEKMDIAPKVKVASPGKKLKKQAKPPLRAKTASSRQSSRKNTHITEKTLRMLGAQISNKAVDDALDHITQRVVKHLLHDISHPADTASMEKEQKLAPPLEEEDVDGLYANSDFDSDNDSGLDNFKDTNDLLDI